MSRGARPTAGVVPSAEPEALVLLVPRDPDWALAIWELGADAVGEARARLAPPLADSEMQLRVYAVASGRRRPVRAYRIATWTGQRLVLIERPGLPHQAAVGFVDAYGAFVPVARSPVTPTPRGGHAAAADSLADDQSAPDGVSREGGGDP